MVTVDGNGTFYTTFDWMGSGTTPIVPSTSSDTNGSAYSTDGGMSWSPPMSTGVTTDRPFFRTDSTTGKIYEEGGLSNRTLAISTGYDPAHPDAGMTYRPPIAFPGDHLAVHGGLIATALLASSGGAPNVQLFGANLSGVAGQSSQLTMYVSKDDGATYTTIPVKQTNGQSAHSGTGDWISADPTHRGRFAVMQQSGNSFEIYVTDDAGQSWRGPTVVSAPGASKPWVDFGTAGVLGLMWKAASLDVYSAVSFDAGHTFTTPLRVSGGKQDPNANVEGDDLSWISTDDEYAYLGWGDTRTGYSNGFFARVPLSLYGPGAPAVSAVKGAVRLTLTGSSRGIPYRRTVTLRGRILKSGVPVATAKVRITGTRPDGRTTLHKTVMTDRDGYYVLTFTPAYNAMYTALANGVATKLRINVRVAAVHLVSSLHGGVLKVRVLLGPRYTLGRAHETAKLVLVDAHGHVIRVLQTVAAIDRDAHGSALPYDVAKFSVPLAAGRHRIQVLTSAMPYNTAGGSVVVTVGT